MAKVFALVSCLSLLCSHIFAAPHKRPASGNVHQMGSLQKRSRLEEPKVVVKAEPAGPVQLSAFSELPKSPVVKMEIELESSSQPMELDAPSRDQELPEEPIASLSGFADHPMSVFSPRGVYVKPNAFKCHGFDLSNIFDEFYHYQCGQQ
jgi:hypothetical protein